MGLALCVFLWGLGYKLSLYDPPQSVTHSLPKAKLLSKNERPRIFRRSVEAQTEQPAVAPLPAAHLTVLFLPAVPVLSLPVSIHRQPLANPLRRAPYLSATKFFVRPPPTPA
jgi:hypothetical protein